MRALSAVFLSLSLLASSGCGSEIGDSCTTNVECSPLGDRTCDTAQVDGYCTVVGCDIDTCPENAVCVRFFPGIFSSVSCDAGTEDVMGPGVTNDCTNAEICLSSGFCAKRAAEQRYCMRMCESDEDCRGGYECRRTGMHGAEALPDPSFPGGVHHQFCAQKQ